MSLESRKIARKKKQEYFKISHRNFLKIKKTGKKSEISEMSEGKNL